ncbi:MAG: succinylglutamate desuccinylase/aspartoacylase family protein [Caulobacterales bacterium]|nr:succinylglutamate desuccinylase/aspartoacylase family protein [Caulobacterales bacterium]
MKLDRREGLPEALQSLAPHEVREVFPNPTLVRTRGRGDETVFVSTLLHGDETTSFFVLQNLARALAVRTPLRSLLIFVGNVAAAERGLRRLPDGEDFNRLWTGGDRPEHAVAAEVIEAARAAAPFASIDVHNNTGANPDYGCVNVLEGAHLHLCSLFARVGVFYTNPKTTQSMAFSRFCPAVTLECGRAGTPQGVRRATELVLDAANLHALNDEGPAPGDLELYETVGRVLVDPEASISFGSEPADVRFASDIDHLNFSEAPAGHLWARSPHARAPLTVVDADQRDITADFFTQAGEEVRLTRPVVPSMVTTSVAAVRLDCLGYLMLRKTWG